MGQHSGASFWRWRVDPCGGWFVGRRWCFVDEALRVFAKRLIECQLAGSVNGVDLAVMHLIRGHQTDPGMVMVLVVPVEKPRQKLLASSMQPNRLGKRG